MNSRERTMAAFRYETPDRIPVGPFTLGALDWESDAAAELIRVTDPIIDLGALVHDGIDPDLVETRDEGNKTTTILHTPMGDLRRVVQRTNITSAVVEFFCKTYDDVDKWLSIPRTDIKVDTTEYYRRMKQVDGQATIMIGTGDGICLPADLFSPETFCMMWIDEPDLMRKLVRIGADYYNSYVEKCCEAGVDAFRIIGGEYASTQLGPKAFQELVVEFDREMVDIIHRHGAIAYFHNHGPVKRFYDLFTDIGIDALDPLENTPYGDCDLVEAKEHLKGKVCIVGNLDDMEVMEKLDWPDIERIATERALQAGPDGFVMGGTASGTYTERGAEMFRRLVPVMESLKNHWV
jgi:uroporphyrinogen decarboxylase